MKRDGFALLLVLLVLGAIELLTLSALALATQETAIVSAQQRTLAAGRAAEAALRRVVRAWPIAAVDSLRVGQSATLTDTGNVQVTIRRNTSGLYLVTAIAPAGRTHIRALAALRTLDDELGMLESNQPIIAAGPVFSPGAQIDTVALSCQPGAFAVPLLPRYRPAGYAFGGLHWEEAASIADTVIRASSYVPPTDSAGGPVVRFVYAAGDLTLSAGPALGVLLVDGSLKIDPGVQFQGIIVVRGQADIGDGVHITGSMIIQGNGVSSIGAARVSWSRCTCAEALTGTAAAGRLITAQRRFIPAF
jgi:hypothetical protein